MKRDDDLEAYLQHATENVIPNIKTSAVVMTILSGKVDAKICLELGAAILLEKPLILFVKDGQQWIPPRLRALADEIVELGAEGVRSEPTMAKVRQAIQRILTRVPQ